MANDYTESDYSDVLTRDDYDRLSIKAVNVIGTDLIDALSRAQINLLNASLDRIIKRRGSVEAVTDMELIGAYEMIVDHVFPASFVALENALRDNE